MTERLAQALFELLTLGGETERSRAYTGVEVLANSGSGTPPPAGFVQIRMEGVGQLARYYGSEPAVNDIVDLIMIEGGEPVVLQNRTSGLGGGWPYDDIITVSATNVHADYTTPQAAVAGAAANQTVLSEPGTFTGAATMVADVGLFGIERTNLVITQSVAQTTIIVPGSGISHLQNCHIQNTRTVNNDNIRAVTVTAGGYLRAIHARFYANNAGTTNAYAYALYCNDDAELWNCVLKAVTGYNSLTSALYVTNGATVHVYGGILDGEDYDLIVAGASTVVLHGTRLVNGTIYIVSGNVYGHYSVGDSSAQRPAMWANGVTRTVGVGKEHATIQSAVDWAKGRNIVGACVLDVDAGSYDEAVLFEDLFISGDARLTLDGDARALAGMAWVDGGSCNQKAIANGGSGAVTLATNAARDQITVTMAVANPDFDADGWGSGDEIIAFCDDGNIYERTINSISPGGAGNNVIELTVALPVGATLGNDGTAVGLKPDRQIERTAAGPCIQAEYCRGVKLKGWFLKSSTGASCYGVYGDHMCHVELENVLTYVEDYGLFSVNGSILIGSDGASSCWGGSYGVVSQNNSFVNARYMVDVIPSSHGFAALSFSLINAKNCIATNCNRGFSAGAHGHVLADGATARQNTTGYYAERNGTMEADNTNANNNGNVTDYSPTPGAIPGSATGNVYGVLYAS